MKKFGWFALIVSILALIIGILFAVKKANGKKSAPKSYASGEGSD